MYIDQIPVQPYVLIYYYYDTNPNVEEKIITEDIVPGIMPNRFMVNTHGEVFDLDFNDPCITRTIGGYAVVSLVNKNKYRFEVRLHRLILTAFKGPAPRPDMVPNHIDGVPSHNWLSNLEWVTTQENSIHAMSIGLHQMYGEQNPNNKLTIEQVKEICELIETGKYWDIEIAQIYGVSYTNISDIHNRKIWKEVSKDYDMSIKKPPKKLLDSDVHKLCQDIESGNYTTAQIAEKYGISVTNVQDIKTGHICGHISKDYDLTVRPANFHIDKETTKGICEAIQSGKYTKEEIQKKFNVIANTVDRIKKHDKNYYPEITSQYTFDKPYAIHTRGFKDEDIIEICKLINEGYSNVEIAKKFGTYQQMIRNIKIGQSYRYISKDYLDFDNSSK